MLHALAVAVGMAIYNSSFLFESFKKIFTRLSNFLPSRVGRPRRKLTSFFWGDFFLRLSSFITDSKRFRNPRIICLLSLGIHFSIFLLQWLCQIDLYADQLKTALYQCIICTNLVQNLFLICLLLHCILLHNPQHQTLKYHNYLVNHCP